MTRPLSQLPLVGIASCLLLTATSFSRADESLQADTSAATNSTARNDSSETPAVQLARARLKLAKVELERALATNKRVQIYSAVTLELLRRNVDICETRLAALSRPSEVNSHAAHLRELEAKLKIAELRRKVAVKLQERLPGSIDASKVEAARLRVEVARLALARARDPAHVATPLDHMQWQLEQLRQEMLDLTLRVEEFSTKY